MDRNGDGKIISIQEFMTCSSNNNRVQVGDNLTENRRTFDLVDQNGDGTLLFDEFITLVYMRASRRPWCNGCGDFIGGLFFSCTECRFGRKMFWDDVTYDLCIPCYHGKLVHEHTDFEDNYSLLAGVQHMHSSPSKTISSPQSSDGG